MNYLEAGSGVTGIARQLVVPSQGTNYAGQSEDEFPVAQGLLESQTQPRVAQLTVEGIAQQMIDQGYDPARDQLSAIASMQASGTPQAVINHALEIAGKAAFERKRVAAAQAAAKAAQAGTGQQNTGRLTQRP